MGPLLCSVWLSRLSLAALLPLLGFFLGLFPLRYNDPSGHQTCAALAPVPPLALGCQVGELAMRYGPLVVNQVSMWADKVPGMADWLFSKPANDQQAQDLTNLSQAGDSASAGDPNGFDPWKWGTSNYKQGYEEYHSVTRDAENYAVHHIIPQKYQSLMSDAGMNVHDPRLMREVLLKQADTGVRIHQRLYTDVWQTWGRELGRQPTAREVIQFAQKLEEQYAVEGTLFYREGANLPGRVEWSTLLNLLQEVP